MTTKQTILKNIMKGANKVTDVVGARDLADYAGAKLAKMTVPKDQRQYVSDTVSGKDALKSAGKLALSLATVSGVGGVARGVGAAIGKAAMKASAKKMVRKAAAKKSLTGFDDLSSAERMKYIKAGRKPFPIKSTDPLDGASRYKELLKKK